MEIGIIGLAKGGKTTVFNALTTGKAETADYSHTTAPNIGVVKVPDPRLDVLSAIVRPKRTIPAEVTYVDYAASARGRGVEGQFLAQLSRADALIHVVRVFPGEEVPHPDGSIDQERDIGTMNLELVFSDLAIIERRLERLKVGLKGAKPQEREAIEREEALLSRVKSALEDDVPLREQAWPPAEAKLLENFQFLTAKPLLLLLNIAECQVPQAAALEEEFAHHRRPGCAVAALCGKLEMELSDLGAEDAREFRAALSLDESALHRVIRVSYGLVGLISFFTIVSEEVKAWTITTGTVVQRAAGKVHSDMERGFIRAEVIGCEDLAKCGSLAEARGHGLLRREGKNYLVEDGDVMTILFNV
ncbi:redox-regulated ATPase YchF [Chloroflexota bacterium]